MAVKHFHGYHWIGLDAPPAPAAPTLSANAAGTLATVTGSTAGSTNAVQVAAAFAGYGSFTWTTAGTRTGDGTVALALADGLYWARVVSTTDGGTAVSNLWYFRVGTPSGLFAHSPADVLRRLLVALGHGTLPSDGGDWPIYSGSEHGTPDECLTVYDTAGRDLGRVMFSGERVEQHGVQVRVRAADHPTGYAKARAVAVALDEDVYQEAVTITGVAYLLHSVSRTGDVIALGKEMPASRRSLFTVNAVLTLERL